MPDFSKMFMETLGRPIKYNGQTVVMVDYLPIKSGQKLCLVFEKFNSEWRQGVGLDIKGGYIRIDDWSRTLDKKIAFWQDTAPSVILFTVHTRDKCLRVKNIWDHGDGVIQSWHFGAAMIVENLENGRRYWCNDGHPDDNFDDIVFRIEFI